MQGPTRRQRVCLIFLAVGFIVAGVLHFIKPAAYIRIMPSYLPWPAQLVAISGFFEILGGVGLFVPAVRRAAAWGLAALLIAVFPANIDMALHPGNIPALLVWARLPLQFVLVWLVLWSGGNRDWSS